MTTLVMSQVPSTVPFGQTRSEVAYEVFSKDEPGKRMTRVWVPYVSGGTEADLSMLTSAASLYLSGWKGTPVPVDGIIILSVEMGMFTIEVKEGATA